MPHLAAQDRGRDGVAGILIGTAVGDALGLPREGLSRRRAGRVFGDGPLRHAFLLGRGMYSDDLEHTAMVAQAWLAAGDDVDRFERELAWRLRWWLAALPAGVGFATLRACLRLWVGFPPARSGVYSAGNGPAMRSAILAACAGSDASRLRVLVRASTRITHTDPRAEEGALAVALAARASLESADAFDAVAELQHIRDAVEGDELRRALETVTRLVEERADAGALVDALGLARGVSGYVNQTVPVALFCWGRWHSDYRTAVEAVIGLGGDTDTTAAITGALVGARIGAAAIPQEWVAGLVEWPRSVSWLHAVAGALAEAQEGRHARPVPWFWPGIVPRNLMFVVVVLLHGFRRLLPPW
jgi:ADP-ribosyl-[dinitrogen reductase] hydrolase